MEEVVVVYLESHDFLSIAKHLLETCDQPRLIVRTFIFEGLLVLKEQIFVTKKLMFLSKHTIS